MPYRSGPTNRSALTALVWAYDRGILDDLLPDLLGPVLRAEDRFGQPEFNRIESLQSLLSNSAACVAFSADLISRFAVCVDDDPDIFDPYYLAEVLLGHNEWRAHFLSVDDGSIYLENFKFELALQSVLRPFVAVVNFLLAPQIFPFVDHYHLRYLLRQFLSNTSYKSVSCIREHLLHEGHWLAEDFLTCYLRNSPDFLLLDNDGRTCAGLTENVLPTWKLASELVPDQQYLEIRGNSWRQRIDYNNICYHVNTTPLEKFFGFHNLNARFSCTDPIEVGLKLRFHRRRRMKTVQNIPENIHSHIVRWIRKNHAIWSTRKARRSLGFPFEFDPSDISPGVLLVYGRDQRFMQRGETGLVLANMVSESKQERGKIHPSRVASGRIEYNFKPTEAQVEQLLSTDGPYSECGILDTRRLARRLLLELEIPTSPYYEKLARQAVQNYIGDRLVYVGQDLHVERALCRNFDDHMRLSERRKCILQELFPSHVSSASILESVPHYLAEIVGRLVR